jgi:two-component system, NtrC family, nitrogen regulation sensor histidine kinase NtrY
MFRRYPYWGWLLICVLLWSGSGYYYYAQNQQTYPAHMARAVNEDLQKREAAFNTLAGRPDLIGRMFSDSLSLQEVTELSNQPFYVFAYHNNYLRFWNTNTILPEHVDTTYGAASLVTNERGIFVQRTMRGGGNGKRLVVIYPVRYSYPVENDYLRSHFVASEHIPVSTRVMPASGRPGGSWPVAMSNGKPLFYLIFNMSDIQKWMPGSLFISLLALTLLASISWIHLMIIHLTRNRSSLVGFIATLLVIIVVRTYLYMAGPPFNMDTLLFLNTHR